MVEKDKFASSYKFKNWKPLFVNLVYRFRLKVRIQALV